MPCNDESSEDPGVFVIGVHWCVLRGGLHAQGCWAVFVTMSVRVCLCVAGLILACHARARGLSAVSAASTRIPPALTAFSALSLPSLRAMEGPAAVAALPSPGEAFLDVVPWLARHFPELPPPSGNMSEGGLSRLLAAVKVRRCEWELELKRLQFVESWLNRLLFKATNRALATVYGVEEGEEHGTGAAPAATPRGAPAPGTPRVACAPSPSLLASAAPRRRCG